MSDASTEGAITENQLRLAVEPDVVLEVTERYTAALSGRTDRSYAAPVQPRSEAAVLAALLLDRDAVPEGDGPWQRAIAGGVRVVSLRQVGN